MKILFVPCALFLSSVYGTYNIIGKPGTLHYHILREFPIRTTTACMMKCDDSSECQVLGIQHDKQDQPIKCLLMDESKLDSGPKENQEDILIMAKIKDDVVYEDGVHALRPEGTWSNWTPWVCSVTCGEGKQQRKRTCPDGKNCFGDDKETKACIKRPCKYVIIGDEPEKLTDTGLQFRLCKTHSLQFQVKPGPMVTSSETIITLSLSRDVNYAIEFVQGRYAIWAYNDNTGPLTLKEEEWHAISFRQCKKNDNTYCIYIDVDGKTMKTRNVIKTYPESVRFQLRPFDHAEFKNMEIHGKVSKQSLCGEEIMCPGSLTGC